MNQDMAADRDLDAFQNGTLIPVRLIDPEEQKEIASNPNYIGETEMQELFAGHWKTFETKVSQITSSTTIKRMLDVATEVDAKVRQVEALKARMQELVPQPALGPVVERDAQIPMAGISPTRPVTP
jgi:hypothetical protein